MIKIISTVNPDGTVSTTREFSDVDEYRAYMQLESQQDQPVHITDLAAPLVLDVPEIVEDENEAFLPLITGKRGPTKTRTLNPPTPAGRWPDLIYLTQEMHDTFMLIRQYPEGLTSEEIGAGMGTDTQKASGRVNRLRGSTPLIEEIQGSYRMTVIGADDSLKIEHAANPSAKNKKLGWDRFMARPLKDGRRKRRRR